jgi:hypothetical protein
VTVKIDGLAPKGDLSNHELSTMLNHVVVPDYFTVHRMASEIVRTRMLVLSIAAILDEGTDDAESLRHINNMIAVEMALRERP